MEKRKLDAQNIPASVDTPERYPPLLVPCEIDVDGTTLDGNCDLDLASKWAAHTFGDQWQNMTTTERSDQVGLALYELRRSAHQARPAMRSNTGIASVRRGITKDGME